MTNKFKIGDIIYYNPLPFVFRSAPARNDKGIIIEIGNNGQRIYWFRLEKKYWHHEDRVTKLQN